MKKPTIVLVTTVCAILLLVGVAYFMGLFDGIINTDPNENNDPTDPYAGLPLTGDINGDGNLNSGDTLFLAHHIAGDTGYETCSAHPDINWDGDVNQLDVDYLGNHLVGNPAYAELYPGS
jgi:hypothetical protein